MKAQYVLVLSLCVASSALSVTPVQKVVQLLDGMLAKGKAEKHDEQVQFAAYKQFCDDTSVEKKRAIEEANEKIEVLKADISKYTADAAQLSKEIAEHEADIATWNGDVEAATKVREIEKTDYDATHKDYSESIDALDRAIAVLKKQAYDRTQASLVQVSALRNFNLIPKEAKKVLDVFLSEEQPAGLDVAAPEAYGYEFQSNGVIDMLEKLLDKFTSERTTLEKEEMNAKHAFDMLIQDLTAQIGQATADKESKSETKAKKLQAKADAEGDLTDTTTTRDADEKYLSDLTATCEQKASDFEARQQLRAEELEAIEKAIEIISSEALAGAADKHLPSLVQARGSALAQLRSDSAQTKARVVKYLQARSAQLNSRVLSALAARVAEDPFTKVKKMIKDLIVRLMEEANTEIHSSKYPRHRCVCLFQSTMKFAGAAVSFVFLFCSVSADVAQVTPVQKVVQLLEGMSAKGKAEKHDEQVQFAAYKQFCDDTSVEKKRAIDEANQRIDVLKADISKYIADAAQMAKEVAEHEADIATWTGDSKAATKVREIEKTDYDAMHKDYSESVDALERAIAVLKKQAYDRSQASFAQVASLTTMDLIPKQAKVAIQSFLEQDQPAGLDVSAPEAKGYEFQSGGVIEMLEKLLDKFTTERTDLEKTEMNAKHAYDMLMQDLTAQIGQATADRDSKSEIKAKKLQSKADAEGELTDTTTTKEADEKYLSDLTAQCEQKASDFESRQQLRAEEIEAIEKAIEILSSDDVAGNAAKHLPTLLQKASTALTQLRSTAQGEAQAKATQFLRHEATRLSSRVLSALAVRVAEDPFAKVKKMIKDLIVRLMEEANEEAEHKGWCDTELSTNEQTRKEKTEAVETLHAEIDELEASIAKLTEDISELTKAVADLDAAMAEATKVRQEEKATNEVTVQDAKDAQTAVAQALTVLKEFYAKAAEATAFVQQKQQPEAPAIFDSAYTGMGAESGGVVGMLEVIESDFARLEADTSAAEATAQKEYDEFMTDSKVDKESKSTDIEHKTAKKQDQTQALTVKKEDLEGTQKELDAALAYFDKLKPSCVDAGVSYEERVARRKEEIESLQEALRILNGEDIA